MGLVFDIFFFLFFIHVCLAFGVKALGWNAMFSDVYACEAEEEGLSSGESDYFADAIIWANVGNS